MRSAEGKLSIVILVLVLVFIPSQSRVLQDVRVAVINGLGHGRIMNLHCRSEDDDLGYNAIPDGGSASWKFRVNLWGTTLFYCDADWDGSAPKRFDAYSYKRDHQRCRGECIWIVREDGLLYGRNTDSGGWGFVPYQNP